MPRTGIVIVGATSAIAQHCARAWLARSPVTLTLVGRDQRRLERVAADLGVRGPESDIRMELADFSDPRAIQSVVDGIAARQPLDIVLIAHGSLPDQSRCETDLQECQRALEINGVSPVLFAEACARHMARTGAGTLAVIGSVAGDRGRKSNYAYGAAKSLVATYVEGLQHRFATTAVRVVLIKPGPTDTPMTMHLKARGVTLAPVETVAQGIVKAVDRRVAVAYVPGRWRFIMAAIRHLPRVVFNRLDI